MNIKSGQDFLGLGGSCPSPRGQHEMEVRKGKGQLVHGTDTLSTPPSRAFNPENPQPRPNPLLQGGLSNSLIENVHAVEAPGGSFSRAFASLDLEGKPGETSHVFNDFPANLSSHLPSTSFGRIPVDDLQRDLQRDLLLNRCYYRGGMKKRKEREKESMLDAIDEDLTIYATSHRGQLALFPAKPPGQTHLPGPGAGCKVVANHFKVDFANSQAFLYSISWLPKKYRTKDEKLKLWVQIEPKFNGIKPLYPGGSRMISPKRLRNSDERITSERDETGNESIITIQYDDGDKNCNVIIIYIETLNSNPNKYLGVDGSGRKLGEDTGPVKFPEGTIDTGNRIIDQLNQMNEGSIEVGRYCFDKGTRSDIWDITKNPKQLETEFLCTMTGYFGSIRALEGGLNLNVDVTSTGFYKPGQSLKDTWCKMVQSNRIPYDVRRPFLSGGTALPDWNVNEERAKNINNYWKNLKIVTTHRQNIAEDPGPTFFPISEVTSESAECMTVEDFSDGQRKNFIEFMREKYRFRDDDLEKTFPAIKLAIKVAQKKDYYLPWGCCKIAEGSRFSGQLEQSLLKELERDVTQRHTDISRRVTVYPATSKPRLQTAGSEDEFYFTVERDMMQVDARALPRPHILVGGKPQQLATDGKYLTEQQFKVPAIVRYWGVISFHLNSQYHQVEDYFISKLKTKANELGMYWGQLPVIEIFREWREWGNQPGTDARDKVQNYVTGFINEIKKVKSTLQPPGELDLILCFVGGTMTPEYATVKYLCDIVHGVPSQVVALEKKHLPSDPRQNEPNISPMFVMNVLLKINVKCGGQNFHLGASMVRLEEERTMLLGADVTHHGRGPSIAAVVATTDQYAVNYACRLKAQESRKEIIELRDMVRELLDVYRDKNDGHYPDNILFFRDGLSELQYLTTLREEGRAILDLAKSLRNDNSEYMPKLMIIVTNWEIRMSAKWCYLRFEIPTRDGSISLVSTASTEEVKRHHTRFFKVERVPPTGSSTPKSEKISNLDAGTVVISGVTHPREYDFFLCSHAPGKGTSRPTHYYVLLDQMNILPDHLYKLVYNLCYTFQRCPRSVSLVTPVYYAHLAAARGKVYLEYYKRPGYQGDLRAERYDANNRLKDRLWFL